MGYQAAALHGDRTLNFTLCIRKKLHVVELETIFCLEVYRSFSCNEEELTLPGGALTFQLHTWLGG